MRTYPNQYAANKYRVELLHFPPMRAHALLDSRHALASVQARVIAILEGDIDLAVICQHSPTYHRVRQDQSLWRPDPVVRRRSIENDGRIA